MDRAGTLKRGAEEVPGLVTAEKQEGCREREEPGLSWGRAVADRAV